MKLPHRFFPLLAALFCGHTHAQKVRPEPAATLEAVPAPLVKPDFRVEGTRTKQLYVVEAPPLPGLPPVEGAITLTVLSVADPGLPDPPAPVAVSEDMEPQERFADAVGKHRETQFAIVSATVFDRSRTLLTCYPHGGGGEAVTAWSNIDFNHMAGLGSFQATRADGEGRSYCFLVGIGNESSTPWRGRRKAGDVKFGAPEIPELPDGGPAFVIVTEKPHQATVDLIEDLHALYRTEGKRLAQEASAREKAYEERKAELLANPPKPKDVTVRFWKREKSAVGMKGGRP